jgi:hypothetical protein
LVTQSPFQGFAFYFFAADQGSVAEVGCVQLYGAGAEFVIGAKLRLAAQLYACAAGGFFLVLVRGGR